MTIYETIKAAVSVPQAAAYYGMKIQRNHMTRCCFHDDHHYQPSPGTRPGAGYTWPLQAMACVSQASPDLMSSMKLNDTYYYCFACLEHGDVIDLVAQLHRESHYAAVQRIAKDFGIGPNSPAPAAAKTRPSRRNPDEALSRSVLTDYEQMLKRWKHDYAPATPDDPVNERYVEACQMLPAVTDMLDALFQADAELRARVVRQVVQDGTIPQLKEYMGYCLIPSTKAQKMMLIIGKGGEGKSRIGLVLNAMLRNAMNMGSIQKVETNQFARADLEHRLLMVDDDMDMNALPKTNYIKSIVTAEAKMDLERKGIQSYQQQLYARFLCFGNGALTSLYDHSDGFYRRQLILTTKDKPADRRDDPYLVEKLLGELEGILLWCLEGLHRLLANDYRFTVSQRAAANVETIKRSSNNVLEFLQSEGYIAFDPAAQASSKALYASYKMWCEDNAVHCLSASRFSSELTQNEQRYGIHATNNIYLPNNKRVRGFTGVKVLFHSLNFS